MKAVDYSQASSDDEDGSNHCNSERKAIKLKLKTMTTEDSDDSFNSLDSRSNSEDASGDDIDTSTDEETNDETEDDNSGSSCNSSEDDAENDKRKKRAIKHSSVRKSKQRKAVVCSAEREEIMRPYSVLYQQQRDYVVQFKNQPGPSDMHTNQAKFASDSGIPEPTFHQWVTKFEKGGYDNIGSGMVKVKHTLQEQLDYVVQFQNQPGPKDTHVNRTQFARDSGVRKPTFHHWVTKFKQGGYDNIGSSANAIRPIMVIRTLQEQLDYVVQFQNQPGPKDTHMNLTQFARDSGIPQATFHHWVTKFKQGGYDNIPITL